jgi:plastocyanin
MKIRMMLSAAAIMAALIPPGAAGAPSGIEGVVQVQGARDSRGAVVYIDRIPGKTFPAPSSPAVLDQRNLTFDPHVLPVLAGTRIAFPNSDEIRHNVFSPSPHSRFNLGTYPRGTTMYHVFNSPGPVTLLCNVHAEMSAYVFVAETPWFAVSDNAGRFVIRDVPPGKYVLKTWHARAKAAFRDIEVPASGSITVNFELRK